MKADLAFPCLAMVRVLPLVHVETMGMVPILDMFEFTITMGQSGNKSVKILMVKLLEIKADGAFPCLAMVRVLPLVHLSTMGMVPNLDMFEFTITMGQNGNK